MAVYTDETSGSSGLVPVETQILGAAAQYIDFTGLSGDKTYFLQIDGKMAVGGGTEPRLSPNLVTTNTTMVWPRTTLAGDSVPTNDRLWANRQGSVMITAWIAGRRGLPRTWSVDMRGGDSAHTADELTNSVLVWNDTTTELTAIRVDSGVALGWAAGTVARLFYLAD
jgi:hypothetical protein